MITISTFLIDSIPLLHEESILRWKTEGLQFKEEGFLSLVEHNHAFNYQLWDAEDKARREDKGHKFVCAAKREIDRYNQQRNNYMEAMDEWLLTALQPANAKSCPLHSETPGMMIDRLSILALKTFHMDAQCSREDIDEHHRTNCQQKWQTLVKQLNQLFNCLKSLIQEVLAKTRTFQVYHQLKMYNDPKLNPQLYEACRQAGIEE